MSAAPQLEFAFEVRAEVGPPVEIGHTMRGRRRIVPILGGTFEGPRLKGRISAGGADWQIVHSDGFSELDTRYTLETDGGDLIYVQNRGVRHATPEVMTRLLAGEAVDASLVYFRTSQRSRPRRRICSGLRSRCSSAPASASRWRYESSSGASSSDAEGPEGTQRRSKVVFLRQGEQI